MRSDVLLASVFAALLVWSGCGRSGTERLVSMEKASWHGTNGTAVTIWLKGGTKDLRAAKSVGMHLTGPRRTHDPADLTVPVMRVEPQLVTLFFYPEVGEGLLNGDLQAELQAGTVDIFKCDPGELCR